MRIPDLLRRRKRRKLARRGFTQTKKIRRTESPRKAEANKRLRWAAAVPPLMILAVWLTASFSTLCRRPYPTFHYVVGQIADRFIYSEVPFEYEDLIQTQRKREDARRAVPPIYRIERAAADTTVKRLEDFSKHVLDLREPEAPGDENAPELTAMDTRMWHLADNLPEDQAGALAHIFANPLKAKMLRKAILEKLNRGVATPDDVESLNASRSSVDRIHILQAAENLSRRMVCPLNDLTSPDQAARDVADTLSEFPGNAPGTDEALNEVLPKIIQPNLAYDFVATQELQEQAAEQIETIKRVWPPDTALISRGQKVTETDLSRLESHQQELHSQRSLRENALDLLFFPTLCLVIVLAAAQCLVILRRDLVKRNSYVVLIGVVLMGQILLTRGTADLYYTYWGSSFYLFPVLPLSLAAMLLSPLVDLKVALWGGGLTALIAAVQHDQSHALQLFFTGALSSLSAAVLMRRARKRLHALRAGLSVGLCVFAVHVLFPYQGEIPVRILPGIFGLACLNGIVAATAASTILPFFEYAFGITTEISLLELSDLNHPLLKRLQMEAPGTYHHSLMVATLAEQAAEAIDADPLLTRVCAYFHDIGKLSYPAYFVENARGSNPHQELQPRMSSLVILNHVKEGIDLALQYKLKRPIREVIAQHHGTSLVYFFYRRALDNRKNGGGESVGVEQDFRYPGPRPKRKEIALISIADACEAAARSLEKPTLQKVEALVDEIVMKRIRDHQLDDADLTFAELAVAKGAIARTLGMMLHGRVRYPEEYDDGADLFKAAAKAASKKQGAAAESVAARAAT